MEISPDRVERIDRKDEGLSIDRSRVIPIDAPPSSSKPVAGDDDLTWRSTLVSAFQNIPRSTYEYGKGIASSLIHPVETAKAVGKMALGAGEKLVPGEQENEQVFDAVVNHYKTRYGSVDGFKQALAKDPVGIIADISTVLTGSGGAANIIGKASGISKVAQAGSLISKMGATMEPLNIAKGIAALPIRLVPESFPISQYQSAVKFGTTLSQKERDAVTKTAIDAANQIMPTSKGMEKLREQIDNLNSIVSEKVSAVSASGKRLNVDDLFKGVEDLVDTMKAASDEPRMWDKALSAKKKEWQRMLDLGPDRTPEQIQKVKTQIYKELEGYYEKFKATPAKVEIRKTIARNAREMIETVIPEIKGLNKREGALIELWDAVETKANRITNRDLIGIGLPVKMGTGSGIGYMFGGAEGAAAGTALGFVLGVYDTPQVKAKLAIVTNRLRQKGVDISPAKAFARLGLAEAEDVRGVVKNIPQANVLEGE